jgi:hypothetical protein
VGALAVLTERSPRRAAGVAMVLAAAMSLALPGLAQDGAGVTVTLQYTDPATGERTPVAGAGFSVSDEAGELVGSDVTDAEGVVLIPVPGRGVYTIEIDPATLPEGVALSNPDRTTATVDVQEGETVRALFALAAGEGAGAGGGITLNRVLQLTFDGLKEGLFLAMGAIGLSLIFGTTGLDQLRPRRDDHLGHAHVAYFFNVYGLVGLVRVHGGLAGPLRWMVELIAATCSPSPSAGSSAGRSTSGSSPHCGRRGTSLIAQMVVTIGSGDRSSATSSCSSSAATPLLRVLRRPARDDLILGADHAEGSHRHAHFVVVLVASAWSCSARASDGRCGPWPTTGTWPSPRASTSRR